MTDELRYDFICLCCGGRNGDDQDCSVRNYLLSGNSDHLPEWYREQRYDFDAWFRSDAYLGSVIIPARYVLSGDHRQFLASLAAVVPCKQTPFLVQSVLCDELIPGVVRLPAYDVTRFDN